MDATFFCGNGELRKNIPHEEFDKKLYIKKFGFLAKSDRLLERDSSPRPAYGAGTWAIDLDVGLRQYMLRVYNFMGVGLGVTGLVAYIAVSTGFYQQIAGTPLIWLVMLAPLGAVLLLSFRIERMSAGAAHATFWAYAALMGLSLAGIFLLYTGTSVARVFFITSGTFAALPLPRRSCARSSRAPAPMPAGSCLKLDASSGIPRRSLPAT